MDREGLWSLVVRSEGALVSAQVASLVKSEPATGLARVS